MREIARTIAGRGQVHSEEKRRWGLKDLGVYGRQQCWMISDNFRRSKENSLGGRHTIIFKKSSRREKAKKKGLLPGANHS